MTAEKLKSNTNRFYWEKTPLQGNKVPSYANRFAEEKLLDKGSKLSKIRIAWLRKNSPTRE
jgi:hypothetical protein